MQLDGFFDPITPYDCTSAIPKVVNHCEQRGYGGLWVPERLHDPVAILSRAASTPSGIQVGSCVLVALARSPMTVAYSANDLHSASGGRFILGLGPQIPLHLSRRFSMPADHPAARMREYVAALRAIWNCWNIGAPLDFRGDFYRHTLMSPFFAPPPNQFGNPKIFISAAGRRMAELAGEVADGLVAPPFASRQHIAEMLVPAAEKGLARAGRVRSDFTVLSCPLVAASDEANDLSVSIEMKRKQVGMFLSSITYRPIMELHGLLRLADELTELSLSGDPRQWRQIGSLITDEVLDLFCIVESGGDVRSTVRRRFHNLVDRVALPISTACT